MCRYCHSLYDNGYLAINNAGLLCISQLLLTNDNEINYNLHYDRNKRVSNYTHSNEKYFNFHFKYIFKNTKNK